MKITTLIITTAVLFISVVQLSSQIVEQHALASKMLYFNSGGFINQSAEVLSPIADSNCTVFSWSLKTLTCVEGTYYQVCGASKFEEGINKTAFRKSADGINWTPLIRGGDSPTGEGEYYQCIYAWKKNNNVHIGIFFADERGPNDQLRFSLSTNGGISFLPSVQISTHNNNSPVYLGGVSGKGDTMVVSWARSGAQTMFSRSVDGGVTWSTMSQVFSGAFNSVSTDIAMDNSGNIYTVIGEDQFFKINLVVRKSTNFGSSWIVMPPITTVTIQQLNLFHQCRFLNNKLYIIWERNRNSSSALSDGIFFTSSTNGASSWSSHVDISDVDTLSNSSNTYPADMHPSFIMTPAGTIYAVWADSRMRNSSNYDSCKFNVYISRSTNDGVSWSQNMLVNGPSNYSRILNGRPDVSVKSSGGMDSVLVTWSKLRNIAALGISQIGTTVPESFSLSQNYPNPFNPVTNIKISIPKSSFVRLIIYDISGREIANPVSQELSAGVYKVNWNASDIASGIYFYKLVTKEFTETKKMMLVK